jgi:hypothetical protein
MGFSLQRHTYKNNNTNKYNLVNAILGVCVIIGPTDESLILTKCECGDWQSTCYIFLMGLSDVLRDTKVLKI